MRGKQNTIEDFWLLIDKSENCWNWLGAVDKDGYGLWTFNGKNIRVHRFSMELAGTSVVYPLISRHLCNNAKCVNPEHVIPGTQRENIQDQLQAGTFSKSKYSAEKMQEIAEEYSKGGITTRELGKKHGISKSTVARAVR